MIRAQHLTEEDPQRDQRRVDAILPYAFDRCQCLRDDLVRQSITKWQVTVLKKLTPEKPHLFAKPSVVRITHRWASLPMMGS